MRFSFATDKRASNLARQIRQLLGEAGEVRSMSACREAVATSTGYRNWNELLKIAGSPTPSAFDEDLGDHEVIERMKTFAARLAQTLDVLPALADHVTSRLRPFASPAVREITDEHVAVMAANISALGYSVEDVSGDGFAAFRVTIPAHTIYSDIYKRDFPFRERTVELHVALDGSAVYGSRERSSVGRSGSDRFTEMMDFAGLENITPNSRVPSGAKIDPAIHQTLRRLDKRALLLLRHSHTVNERAYRDAVSLPPESPIYRECYRYPVLARQFGGLSYRLDGTYLEKAGKHAGRIFSEDPVGSFTEWIEDRAAELWPGLPLSPEHARETVEHYLSVPMKGVAGVDPNAAAFLCHVPSHLWPRTSAQLGACVDFVDCHIHLIEPLSMGGMGVLPTTFGTDFARRANGDWAEMGRLSTISYMAFHQDIGSTLIAGAAREAGYEVFSYDFEERRRGEISYDVAAALLAEVELSFFDVVDFHGRWDAAIQEVIRRPNFGNRTDEEVVACEDADFELFFEFGLINPRHRGRPKVEVLNSLGFDIHSIVAISEDDFGDEEDEPEEAPAFG